MKNQSEVHKKAIIASIAVIILSFYFLSHVQGYFSTFSSNQDSSDNNSLQDKTRRSEETIDDNKKEE